MRSYALVVAVLNEIFWARMGIAFAGSLGDGDSPARARILECNSELAVGEQVFATTGDIDVVQLGQDVGADHVDPRDGKQ